MASHEESILAVLGAVAAALYLFVARLQAKRTVSDDARPALNGFILWWAGLGALGLLGLFFEFGPDLSAQGMVVVSVVIYIFLAIIMALMAGLVHYLLYLYTGRKGTIYLAYGFYGFMMLFSVWYLQAHDPHIAMGHLGTPQEGEVAYHLHTEPATWVSAFFSFGLILPALGAAIAYALLFFRTQDPTARYRIAMVSVGLILWFLFSTANTVGRVVSDSNEQGFTSQLISQLLGVFAATLTLLAYQPPRWIRDRLGLREMAEPRIPEPPKPRVMPA